MSFADTYIQKHLFTMPQIKIPPSRDLSYVVVIPAYLEDAIINVLESIKNTRAVEGDIEVLIIVNYSKADSKENKTSNKKQHNQVLKWCERNSVLSLRFFVVLASDLPPKHAGAGLARKIGMDEALHRFGLVDNPQGIILSLDADTLIEPDYFLAIEKEFYRNTDLGGCIIPFAHPIKGNEFPDRIYTAGILYELHLRYYRHALRMSGFPYAYYTIGSCFGVRAGFYAQQGGMNRRKAGEDFYFLNKLFPHQPFCEIKGTCVHPSPRPSLRVPFGTGPVIQKIADSENLEYLTYNLKAFTDLNLLFDFVSELYFMTENNLILFLEQLPQPLNLFLVQNEFLEKLKEIKKNTASESSFEKRFFLWFDGFKVVKYLNFTHQNYYKKTDVTEAAKHLVARMNRQTTDDTLQLLYLFRQLDLTSNS